MTNMLIEESIKLGVGLQFQRITLWSSQMGAQWQAGRQAWHQSNSLVLGERVRLSLEQNFEYMSLWGPFQSNHHRHQLYTINERNYLGAINYISLIQISTRIVDTLSWLVNEVGFEIRKFYFSSSILLQDLWLPQVPCTYTKIARSIHVFKKMQLVFSRRL